MSEPERTLEWTLERVEAARMKTLALILADPNPIHFDPDAAARLGTGGRLVNQGPGTIAFVYNLFTQELPDRRVRRLDVRLLGNVLEGDRVAITAQSREGKPDVYDVLLSVGETPKLSATAWVEPREVAPPGGGGPRNRTLSKGHQS